MQNSGEVFVRCMEDLDAILRNICWADIWIRQSKIDAEEKWIGWQGSSLRTDRNQKGIRFDRWGRGFTLEEDLQVRQSLSCSRMQFRPHSRSAVSYIQSNQVLSCVIPLFWCWHSSLEVLSKILPHCSSLFESWWRKLTFFAIARYKCRTTNAKYDAQNDDGFCMLKPRVRWPRWDEAQTVWRQHQVSL